MVLYRARLALIWGNKIVEIAGEGAEFRGVIFKMPVIGDFRFKKALKKVRFGGAVRAQGMQASPPKATSPITAPSSRTMAESNAEEISQYSITAPAGGRAVVRVPGGTTMSIGR